MDNEFKKRYYDLQNIERIFYKNMLAEFNTECDLKKVNVLIDVLSKPFEPMTYSQMG